MNYWLEGKGPIESQSMQVHLPQTWNKHHTGWNWISFSVCKKYTDSNTLIENSLPVLICQKGGRAICNDNCRKSDIGQMEVGGGVFNKTKSASARVLPLATVYLALIPNTPLCWSKSPHWSPSILISLILSDRPKRVHKTFLFFKDNFQLTIESCFNSKKKEAKLVCLLDLSFGKRR